MGTYISHFRNVEKLLTEIKDLDEEAFLFGNLAPDSGIPNEDGSEFDPPRTITHFLQPGDTEGKIGDMVFYRRYLSAFDRNKGKRCYSFLLGYFLHLICDNLWSLWVVAGTLEHYAKMIQQHGAEMWKVIRQDWHDLDRKYYAEHPESEIWHLMRSMQNPPDCLEYLPSKAMSQQIKYIENTYLAVETGRDLGREYPYLNEGTMDRFVDESTKAVLEILDQEAKLANFGHQTALKLLAPEKLRPYEYPIGDTK
jgi:hypothetical protein